MRFSKSTFAFRLYAILQINPSICDFANQSSFSLIRKFPNQSSLYAILQINPRFASALGAQIKNQISLSLPRTGFRFCFSRSVNAFYLAFVLRRVKNLRSLFLTVLLGHR
jgi:hypothetical protein